MGKAMAFIKNVKSYKLGESCMINLEKYSKNHKSVKIYLTK